MIAFNTVSKQYGRQILFVEATFQLNPGEKIRHGDTIRTAKAC